MKKIILALIIALFSINISFANTENNLKVYKEKLETTEIWKKLVKNLDEKISLFSKSDLKKISDVLEKNMDKIPTDKKDLAHYLKYKIEIELKNFDNDISKFYTRPYTETFTYEFSDKELEKLNNLLNITYYIVEIDDFFPETIRVFQNILNKNNLKIQDMNDQVLKNNLEIFYKTNKNQKNFTDESLENYLNFLGTDFEKIRSSWLNEFSYNKNSEIYKLLSKKNFSIDEKLKIMEIHFLYIEYGSILEIASLIPEKHNEKLALEYFQKRDFRSFYSVFRNYWIYVLVNGINLPENIKTWYYGNHVILRVDKNRRDFRDDFKRYLPKNEFIEKLYQKIAKKNQLFIKNTESDIFFWEIVYPINLKESDWFHLNWLVVLNTKNIEDSYKKYDWISKEEKITYEKHVLNNEMMHGFLGKVWFDNEWNIWFKDILTWEKISVTKTEANELLSDYASFSEEKKSRLYYIYSIGHWLAAWMWESYQNNSWYIYKSNLTARIISKFIGEETIKNYIEKKEIYKIYEDFENKTIDYKWKTMNWYDFMKTIFIEQWEEVMKEVYNLYK